MRSTDRNVRRSRGSVPGDSRGQALLEAPITMLTLCVVVLVLIQLGVWFFTYLMVATTSADLCRVIATDDQIAMPLLTSHANDRLQALGRGTAFCIPGSLRVDVTGDKRSHVSVAVRVEQRPLPLIRTISAGLVPSRVPIEAVSRSRGTYHDVEGEPHDAPYRYGNVSP